MKKNATKSDLAFISIVIIILMCVYMIILSNDNEIIKSQLDQIEQKINNN